MSHTPFELQSNPVRVAHLIHTMAHGGVETALLNWMRTFDRARVAAHVICFENPGGTERPFIDAAARLGITVHRVPWGRSKPVWRAARATAQYLRAHDIELLHCHNTYADIVGLLAARWAHVKTLVTLYVWGGHEVGLKRRVLQRIDQLLLGRFNQVSAHCEATRQATADRGVPLEQIELLTCGFSDRVAVFTADERERRRRAMNVTPDHCVLINVARFWPEKAHDVLLHAFAELRRTHPATRLWILGVGPEEQAARLLCSSLGLESFVDFLGFRTDLPELLALADVQVHPSDTEGVALAILAGMAAGRAIVATNVGGLAEVIVDGTSGVLVAPRQPLVLAAALRDVLDDPERRAALGAAAQRFVEHHYSLSSATRRVEAVYARMAGRCA